MKATTSRAAKLEQWRRRLNKRFGRHTASYRELARRCNRSISTVHKTLTEREHEFQYDRAGVMDEVEAVLDEIESEHETEAADA